METIVLSKTNLQQCAERAAEVLRAGGVILYPTDTLYALGVDTINKQAVEKVLGIKHRVHCKKMSSVFADIDRAIAYAPITLLARELADAFFPGKLTIALSPEWGVRVPDHPFCRALADAFQKPFAATSANISGESDERRVEAILAQLGKGGEEIDLVVDAGELPPSLPSTIVDCSGSEPVVVREGAIPATEIFAALGR